MSGGIFAITNTSPMTSGRVGVYYPHVNITYTEGTGTTDPLFFYISEGMLPPGLAIGGGGIIAPFIDGTPTAAGIYTFKISAADSSDPQQTCQSISLTITIDSEDGRSGALFVGTVTAAPSGESYEVFQSCLGNSPVESIAFDEYEPELGNGGYETSTLYGPDTGRKRWKLTFPIMSGASADLKISGPHGMAMTLADYVWDLYCRTKKTGKPFIIQSARNDQFYLVKFSNPSLEFERFVTQLYASALELKQMRIPGFSIFDPAKLRNLWGWYERESSFDYGAMLARDLSGNGHDLTIVGGVANNGDTQNALQTQRLNGSTGFLRYDGGADLSMCDFLMVFKYRGSTFSNVKGAGILTQTNAFNKLLVGTHSTSILSSSAGQAPIGYWKNSIPYDVATNMQAPMNLFGLIHARYTPGVPMGLQIGKSNATTGTFSAIDIGAIYIVGGPTPETDLFELAEHAQTVWDL